jgi:hypothetical protein
VLCIWATRPQPSPSLLKSKRRNKLTTKTFFS